MGWTSLFNSSGNLEEGRDAHERRCGDAVTVGGTLLCRTELRIFDELVQVARSLREDEMLSVSPDSSESSSTGQILNLEDLQKRKQETFRPRW